MQVVALLWTLGLSAFFVVVVRVSLHSICKPQPEGKRLTITFDGERPRHEEV